MYAKGLPDRLACWAGSGVQHRQGSGGFWACRSRLVAGLTFAFAGRGQSGCVNFEGIRSSAVRRSVKELAFMTNPSVAAGLPAKAQ
jgi:hypothetical protein